MHPSAPSSSSTRSSLTSSSSTRCSGPFSSSIGRKFLMAVTGVLLVLFVVGHLLGNLQIFLGREAFNSYAAFLHNLGPMLWVVRIGLLAVFLVHVTTAFSLRRTNQSARPDGYLNQATLKASAASLYMVETGMILLVFVFIHLLHFTFMSFHPEFSTLVDAKGRHDTYAMVIRGFQSAPYASVYIFSMIMLGLHLSHGISSAFHTLGFYHDWFQPRLKAASVAIGYGLAVGYIAIPLSVQLGLLRLAV